MTREQFAELIHWTTIIWFIGFVNVVAMLPQLVDIVRTRETRGLSLKMISTYAVIQIAFSIQGYFRRDTMLMVCLGLSALVSLSILVIVMRIRNQDKGVS